MEKSDYENGKIYKLFCDGTDKIYIGSTCKDLSKRLQKHKGSYHEYGNLNKNRTAMSRVLFGIGHEDDVDIKLIENFPCENKNELQARERYWIQQNQQICLNKVIPQRTSLEYYHDHKEQYAKHHKKYYDSHKEQFSARAKTYREEHKEQISVKESIKTVCECGGKYSPKHKARHMQTGKHKFFEKLSLI